MDVDVSADALRVNDDDRSLWSPKLLVENPVRLRHPAMRPVVGTERVLDPAKRFGPGFERVDGVAQDAHDLGLAARETLLERVQRGGFVVSGVGERECEEREHHAPSAEVRQLDLAPVVRAQREVWRDITNLEGLRLARDLRSALPWLR